MKAGTASKVSSSVVESPTERLRRVKEAQVEAGRVLMALPPPPVDAPPSDEQWAAASEFARLSSEVRILESALVIHQAATSVASTGYGAWQVEDRACGDFAVDQVHYTSKKIRRWAVFPRRQEAHDCAMALNILREVRP